MSEKPLLLSSAKSGILLAEARRKDWLLYAAAAMGMFVVLYGAADIVSRVAHSALGGQAGALSFAPAVALVDPSVLNSFAPAATTSGLIPAHLTIPSIGVSADVERVGKTVDGAMGTPSNFTNVAWYALGAKPGEPGNAVIDGHVNNALTTSGVFEHLSQVKLGDVVTVADSGGRTLSYRVTEVQEYPATTTPAASIFAATGPSQLVLITCDGSWVSAEHQFDKRLVVVAALQ